MEFFSNFVNRARLLNAFCYRLHTWHPNSMSRNEWNSPCEWKLYCGTRRIEWDYSNPAAWFEFDSQFAIFSVSLGMELEMKLGKNSWKCCFWTVFHTKNDIKYRILNQKVEFIIIFRQKTDKNWWKCFLLGVKFEIFSVFQGEIRGSAIFNVFVLKFMILGS